MPSCAFSISAILCIPRSPTRRQLSSIATKSGSAKFSWANLKRERNYLNNQTQNSFVFQRGFYGAFISNRRWRSSSPLLIRDLAASAEVEQPQTPHILVCGDGDLSYSASIASELSKRGVQLTATVLETEDIHRSVYSKSLQNSRSILQYEGHSVRFGVDATNLKSTLGNNILFDRIQFNFPHWGGKTNTRYNRTLLNDFLQSASDVLAPSGEVHVALRDGQGGARAKSMTEWRQSWMAPVYAATHGFLLVDIIPFAVTYELSSYRGRNEGFFAEDSIMYIFSKPPHLQTENFTVDPKFQLCYRYELRMNLTQSLSGGVSIYTEDDIVNGNAVHKLVQSVLPSGMRVEIPLRDLVKAHGAEGETRIALFLIVFCGESIPLTKSMADDCRKRLEEKIMTNMMIRTNRAGRAVSRPFPYSLLQHLIDERK